MQVANINKQSSWKKGAFKAIFLILIWFIIVSLAQDVLHIQRGFRRVSEAKTRLDREEIKNKELVARYEMVQTSEYRERLIREQLNMQKEGEVLAVLPKGNGNTFVPKEKDSAEVPNWKRWINLLY